MTLAVVRTHIFTYETQRNILNFLDSHISGIDPGKWESVFESFEQADPSTTRL